MVAVCMCTLGTGNTLCLNKTSWSTHDDFKCHELGYTMDWTRMGSASAEAQWRVQMWHQLSTNFGAIDQHWLLFMIVNHFTWTEISTHDVWLNQVFPAHLTLHMSTPDHDCCFLTWEMTCTQLKPYHCWLSSNSMLTLFPPLNFLIFFI